MEDLQTRSLEEAFVASLDARFAARKLLEGKEQEIQLWEAQEKKSQAKEKVAHEMYDLYGSVLKEIT